MRAALLAITLSLALAMLPCGAQLIPTNPANNQIILTDPLVEINRLGVMPTGMLTAWDPRTGMALAQVPGAGVRRVRLAGAPVATPAGPAIGAMDLATDIPIVVVLPPVPEALVPARVLQVTANGVTVRRQGASAQQAEILPPGSIYVTVGGRTLPATVVNASLAPGARVLIPAGTGARGVIQVQPPLSSGERAR
jgi:hypothetical protein